MMGGPAGGEGIFNNKVRNKRAIPSKEVESGGIGTAPPGKILPKEKLWNGIPKFA